jgi:hypothetical protein
MQKLWRIDTNADIPYIDIINIITICIPKPPRPQHHTPYFLIHFVDAICAGLQFLCGCDIGRFP